MGIKESAGGLFRSVGMWTVSIFQWVFTQKPFKLFGMIAFILTIWQGIARAIIETQPQVELQVYIGHLILNSVKNIALIILSVDNDIYLLSKQYMNIALPTLWQTIKAGLFIIKDIYFYLWWYKIFESLFINAGKTLGTDINQSTGKFDLFRTVIGKYLLFFVVMNFVGMIGTGVITFQIPQEMNLINKTIYFFNTNFATGFDFVFKLFPFKGLTHFMIFSLGKMVSVIIGTYVGEQLINSTNLTK